LWLHSLMTLEATFTILEASFTLVDDVYVTGIICTHIGITYDDCNIFIVQAQINTLEAVIGILSIKFQESVNYKEKVR
jgi:hypothetical protein